MGLKFNIFLLLVLTPAVCYGNQSNSGRQIILLKSHVIDIIVGLIGFIVVVWLYNYFVAGVSKATGTNVSYRGKITHRPGDFDQMNKEVKDSVKKMVNVFREINDVAKTHTDEYKRKRIQNLMTTGDKINQLKELEELRKSGTINDLEFDVIKSEILK